MARPSRLTSPSGGVAVTIALLGGVFIIVALGSAALYAYNAQHETVYGVRVAGISLYNTPYEEARVQLQTRLDEFYAKEIAFRAGDTTRTSLPAFTGMDIVLTQTLDEAYRTGRNTPLPNRILTQASSALVGHTVEFSVSFDEKAFDRFVANIFGPLHTPAQNASYAYNASADSFDFVTPKEGTVIDLELLKNDLRARAQNLSSEEITVVRKDQQPITATAGTQEALAAAEEVLARGLTLATQDDSWKVSRDDLASWISFEPRKTNGGSYELTVAFSQDAIESYLAELAPGLNTPARDAQFTIVNGRVEAFQLERPGYQLRLAESAQTIQDSLEKNATKATLLFDSTPPSITIEDIENLNINALLGKGESDFAGSPANRIHNIKVGSSKYQGMIIAPGEEFSFNKNLGEVDAANGYLPELVIKNNQTVPEYGGGICQVSTTLFRAAVYAGLAITARQNHSYVVRYYGTPGFDATIYPPFPDMRFRNNTPGHILIQYRIVGTKLIFEIYGQDDGRNVEVIGPILYDQQENGAVKAWVKQTATNTDGAIIEEQTFYSTYRSAENYPVNRNPLE